MRQLLLILLTINILTAATVENLEIVNSNNLLKKVNKLYVKDIDKTASYAKSFSITNKDFRTLRKGVIDPNFGTVYENIKSSISSGNVVAAYVFSRFIKDSYRNIFGYYKSKKLAPRKNIANDYRTAANVLNETGTCRGAYIKLDYLYRYFDLKDAYNFAKSNSEKCKKVSYWRSFENKVNFRAAKKGLIKK